MILSVNSFDVTVSDQPCFWSVGVSEERSLGGPVLGWTGSYSDQSALTTL